MNRRLRGGSGTPALHRWLLAGARLAISVLACALVAGVITTPASAEEQPSILKAYGLDWIERVREDAWPQPKEQRPIICLLDTGVAVTPDTPEDNPLGPIVARLALDGGDGLPQGTQFEHLHGTQMASVIAAPRNGYGTVGVFPQARIVSVRVTEGSDTFITPRAVALGVNRCANWSHTADVRVAAIVMAESNYDQRSADNDTWTAAARRAAAAGAVFVAAAGNSPGAHLVAPISIAEVLAVAAGDSDGNLCSFVKLGGSAAIAGPGCSGQDWPSGSSAATAAVGALASVVVTKLPASTAGDARAVLESDAVVRDGGQRHFSGLALMERSFPDGVTESAMPPIPTAPASAPQSTLLPEVSEPTLRTRLWRPKLIANRSSKVVRLRRLDFGPRGTIVARTVTARGAIFKRSAGRSLNLPIPLLGRATSVEVWIEGKTWRSLSRRVKVTGR